MSSISCIIPFLNEEARIGAVLNEVIKVNTISQIIAVDGGSTDHGYDFVKKNFPQVGLIKMNSNQGKTETVRKGLKAASGEYILLLDADLIGLEKEELEKIISYVLKHREVDMLIMKRTKTPFFSRLIRSDLVFSGERIMKKTDLERILSLKLTKYQLEIATNKYMTDNHKKIYWFQSSNENTPKVAKTDWLSGYWEELKMKANVIGYDPLAYHWQILFFARNKITL